MSITVGQPQHWRDRIRQVKDDALAARIMGRAADEYAQRERGDSLRLSSSGNCRRRLAYQHLNFLAAKAKQPAPFEPEPMQGRRVLVFHLGHLVEMSIKDWLLKERGRILDLSVIDRDRVSIAVDGTEITGHPDALYQEDDGSLSVMDVKSIAAQGFDRVDLEGPPYEAVCQLMSYMKALGLKRARTLHYEKNASHIVSWIFDFDHGLMQTIEDRFRSVMQSTIDNLPAGEYEAQAEQEWVRGVKQLGLKLAGDKDGDGKAIIERKQNGYYRLTGRQVLGYPCSYCPFKEPCKGPLIQEMDGDTPTWIVPAPEAA